jgi:nicotinate dehydrogenase subunit A
LFSPVLSAQVQNGHPAQAEGDFMPLVSFIVDGRPFSIEVDPTTRTTLLSVLINDVQLNGPKFGCGLAQCGACTVLLDGRPIRSCVQLIGSVDGREVTTIAGLGTKEKPHPIQRAFIEEQAAQCAYCISGIMLYGKTFIDDNPNATEEQIIQALNGLLCRCYSHLRMIRALRRYQQEVQS